MTSARTPEFNQSYSIGGSISVGTESPGSGAVLELESQFAQQTKAQISRIVAEIGELSRQGIDRSTFFAEFLHRVVTAMGAIGAAVWRTTNDGQWILLAGQNLPIELVLDNHIDKSFDYKNDATESSIDSPENAESSIAFGPGRQGHLPSEAHSRLMNEIITERQPVLVPPRSVAVASLRPSNPIEQLLIFSPVPFDSPDGLIWIEVVQRPSGGPATQRGYLRFVAQMADLAADFLKTHRLRELEQERVYLLHAEQLLQRISNSESRPAAFRDLADTLRSISLADQAFVVYRSSRRTLWRIVAASGLDEVDPRGEGAVAIDRLAVFASHTVQASCASWSKESDDGRDANLDRFLKLFQANYVAWSPIIGCDPIQSPLGIAVIQTWNSSSQPIIHHPRAITLTKLILTAIRPKWMGAAGRALNTVPYSIYDVLFPSRWSSFTQVIAASLLVVGIGMIPVPIRISAPATLHPSHTKILYAQADGIVKQVNYDHGDLILESNRVLMTIENPDFNEKLIKARSDLASLHAEADFRDRESGDLTRAQEYRVEQGIRAASLKEESKAKKSQIESLEQFINDKLTVTADSDSFIGTWRLKELMSNRPVHAGDVVAILYPKNSRWLVEAEIPERDSHLLHIAKKDNRLPNASVFLKSDPNKRMVANFANIDSQFVPSSLENGTQVVRVNYELLDTDERDFKDGLTGLAQIDCNHAPLAWALFRDAINAVWTTFKLWI